MVMNNGDPSPPISQTASQETHTGVGKDAEKSGPAHSVEVVNANSFDVYGNEEKADSESDLLVRAALLLTFIWYRSQIPHHGVVEGGRAYACRDRLSRGAYFCVSYIVPS